MSKPPSLQRVLACSHELPVFPRVITRILETLDDPDANLNRLVADIEQDPVMTGRVISLANRADSSRGKKTLAHDVFTAISLVGFARVREAVILSRLSSFLGDMMGVQQHFHFWEHSVAVGVCSQELASLAPLPICVDSALVAGLLHDVGQLWLHRFEAEAFEQCWQVSQARGDDVTLAEREHFGVDHGTIGAWLAQGWGLPDDIGRAIAHHHAPDVAPREPLVAVVHVAEVLSNALNLIHNDSSRVIAISAASCDLLGLTWGDASHALFGRLEARSHYAGQFFAKAT